MQGNVSISTNDSKIEVIRGNEAVTQKYKDMEPLALASVRYILSDINDIRTRYIALGFHLKEFFRNGYYLAFGYWNPEDFYKTNFGMDGSAVSRCIAVYEEFSRDKSMHLDEKYMEYNYSQLCEMLPMSKEERKEVSPDMTIKQIRELKKTNKLKKGKIATSQKFLDCKKVLNITGAALKNYIKGVSSLRSVRLNVYDKEGKLLVSQYVSLLGKDNDSIYIRTWNTNDTLEYKN